MFKTFINKLIIVFVGNILLCPFISLSQQYNFKNYSVENGLPYIQIYAMFQDSKGYLWSGGYGGLSKFNGKTFQNYSPKNGLANHYVNAIIEDQFHLITVGTIDGLSVIDKVKGQISNYYVKDGLPSDNVTCFCLDPRIGLWTGTDKGLCIWDGKKVIQVPFFKNQRINSLLYTVDFEVLIGTDKGLYKQQGDKFEIVLNQTNVTCLSQNDQNKTICVGTVDGLYFVDLNTKTQQVFHVSNGLLDETINAILCEKNGVIWIGSKSGLISFNGKEFSYYNVNFDNNSNHIRALLNDYEGNLWIGTHNGLYKFRGKGFTLYDRHNGLGGAFIYQITKDNNQNLWIGTESNGAYKLSNGYFKNYSTKEGLLDNKVSSILTLDDGSVWMGTDKGISIFRNEKFENILPGPNFKQQVPINTFYLDSKKNIWVAGKNKVTCFKKNGPKYFPVYYPLNLSHLENKECDVWSILEDDNGQIWAGTYLAGLYKLDNGTFKRQAITSPAVTTALDLCKDNYGNMYAATLNGVLMFNHQKNINKLISEKDGLSSELVYALGLTKR